MKGYYFITDSGLSRAGNISDVRNAVRAGVEVVQYREKSASTKHMYEEALILRGICKDVTFIINDRIDVALASGADGVHIGQDDMPYILARKILGRNKIIGVTVHSVEEAGKAQKMGADYLGVSPIFATRTKKDAGLPAGVALIKGIKKAVSIPIVAIGGIDLSNATSVIHAGADCICAISAVITTPSVKKEIEKFRKLM